MTTLDLDVSFVERQFNGARGPFLRRVDKLKKRVHLCRVPKTIVDHFSNFGTHSVAEMHQVSIHRQLFEVAMGCVEDCHPGGFVDATALHTDKTIFNDVDLPDTVSAADFIKVKDHLQG